MASLIYHIHKKEGKILLFKIGEFVLYLINKYGSKEDTKLYYLRQIVLYLHKVMNLKNKKEKVSHSKKYCF